MCSAGSNRKNRRLGFPNLPVSFKNQPLKTGDCASDALQEQHANAEAGEVSRREAHNAHTAREAGGTEGDAL